MASSPIIISHNFRSDRFHWLWAKYVVGINDTKHCTNVLRGPYSKLFSGHNSELESTPILAMSEQEDRRFFAIYFCGVAKTGYPKKNYPHNIHAALVPKDGAKSEWSFENWFMTADNGDFTIIPGLSDIPARYRSLPDEYTTCRIFRWAVVEGARLSAGLCR